MYYTKAVVAFSLVRKTNKNEESKEPKWIFISSEHWVYFVFILFCQFLLLLCFPIKWFHFLGRENKPVYDFHLKISGPLIQCSLAQSQNLRNAQSCSGDGGVCAPGLCPALPTSHGEVSTALRKISPWCTSSLGCLLKKRFWIGSGSYLFSMPR